MQEIMQLIGLYGFPVVACIGMGWFVVTQIDKSRTSQEEANKLHKEEITALQDGYNTQITKVTDALNNNTLAMQRLCDKMESR